MPTPIPGFLLPRGPPSALTLRALQRQSARRSFTSTSAALKKASKSTTNANSKPRVLAKPDRFRPPSHPQRLTTPSPKNAPPGQPFEYGPRTTEKERIQQNKTQYPGMFPPEGTVMFKFLTSKWIHIWIAMVSLRHRPSSGYTKRTSQITNQHTECPTLLRRVHFHNKLQSNLAVRSPATILVGSADVAHRHDLAGIICVAHACAAQLDARAGTATPSR
jgi:hypothetical protein